MDLQELDEVIREFFPRSEHKVNNDTEAVNEEPPFSEPIESDQEMISRLSSNYSQDQGCVVFEEDPCLDNLRDTISLGCSCHLKCFDKFQCEEIKEHILTMRELSRDEKDMYLMGKLRSKGTGIDASDRKRQRYMYNYDDREVCKEAFLVMHDIGEKYLKTLIKHMKLNGPVPRSHGNKGRKPKHALSFPDIKRVVNFIVRYSEECGLPLPAMPHGNDAVQTPVLLPASSTKVEIHSRYKSVCEESNERSVELSTFKSIWLQCVPHIKIASPRSDVCPKCETLRCRAMGAVSEEEKLIALHDYKQHIEISQGGLSSERLQYLYKHVRPFVKSHAREATCPTPTEE